MRKPKHAPSSHTHHVGPQQQGKTSQFAPFGAGVTSYFKLLKYFSWSFLVVSFMVLPHLFVNTSGDAITTVTTNTDKMSWTTMGNLGGGRGNYSSVVGLTFLLGAVYFGSHHDTEACLRAVLRGLRRQAPHPLASSPKAL